MPFFFNQCPSNLTVSLDLLMYPQRPHFQPPRHNLVTKLSLKILSERVFASCAAVDVEDEGVAAAPVTPVTPVAAVTVEAVV